MLGRYCCRSFLSRRCTLEHSMKTANEGRSTTGAFIWWLLLFVSVLGGGEVISGPLGAKVSIVSASFAVPAGSLLATANSSTADDEGGGLRGETAADVHRQRIPFPSNSHQEVAHCSLSYWAAEADFSGESDVEAYTVVNNAESAALYFTPFQLQTVSHLIQTTRREKLVEDEDRFRDHRFTSFTAELGDFAQAKFRPFESRRAEALRFKPVSGRHLNHEPQHKVDSDAKAHQRGDDFTIERVQLLEAVPGLLATKVSVVVARSKPQWSSTTDSPTCPGERCVRDVEKIRSLETPFDSARPVQRRVHGSHELLQGFVSEVEGPVPDTELERELRWELHIWRYLPAWRAAELAEKEHILIPMNLLRHERASFSFEAEKLAHQRRQQYVPTKNRVEEGSTIDFIQAHGAGDYPDNATNVDTEKEHSWTDRISDKVYNVFIYYPKGYRDTISSSLIPSDQVTETWYRTATTDFLLSVSTQMLLAVANLNSYGLVHTHIRPSSFVVDLDGVVLLSDLHRAVAVGETMDCLSDRVKGINDLTASPEESACMYKYASNFEEHQDRKEFVAGPMPAEFPVDSWRLGVILYRLWCREPAHDRRSDHEFHFRHLKVRATGRSVAVDAYLEENRLPMEYCRKDIPSSLQRLIRQLLVAEPTFRVTAADAVKKSSLFHHLVHQRKQAVKDESADVRQELASKLGENA